MVILKGDAAAELLTSVSSETRAQLARLDAITRLLLGNDAEYMERARVLEGVCPIDVYFDTLAQLGTLDAERVALEKERAQLEEAISAVWRRALQDR